MNVRRMLLIVAMLLATAVGGCKSWMPASEEHQIPEPEVTMPKFRRPRASVNTYSLSPRGQAIERSLGLR